MDRKTLEDIKRLYIKEGVTLRDFRIERNGNGRDFDVIPFFGGDFGVVVVAIESPCRLGTAGFVSNCPTVGSALSRQARPAAGRDARPP